MQASWTPARLAALVGVIATIVGAVALGLLVSVWFLAPVPLLAAATYAIVLGMTPSRFLDALDDPSGAGTHPPL